MEEIIKQYVSIWNNKSISNLGDVFTEHSSYWDATQQGKSIDILGNTIIATHEAFSDLSFEVLSISSTIGNRVFLEWLMKGTHSGKFYDLEATGKTVEITGLDNITCTKSKISKIKSFYDSSLFNQQLGV